MSTRISNIFEIYSGFTSDAEKTLSCKYYEGALKVLVAPDKYKYYYNFKNPEEAIAILGEETYKSKVRALDRVQKRIDAVNNVIKRYLGQPCLYFKGFARKYGGEFFTGNVQFFGGVLKLLIPKERMTTEEFLRVQAELNEKIKNTRFSTDIEISSQKQYYINYTFDMFGYLNEITKYLLSKIIKIDKPNKDNRVNSSLNEKNIINLISEKFDIITVEERYYCDFYVKQNGAIYPCNIKITKGRDADNTGGNIQLLQAFTNFNLDAGTRYSDNIVNPILLEKMMTKQYNREVNKDYYFLIILTDGSRVENIFPSSVLRITQMTYNMDNLPFQVRWRNNMIPKRINIPESIAHFKGMINSHRANRKLSKIEILEKLSLIP
jgi:hypothetical protein